MPPKTAEEVDVVEAYGGEIIFTPGDIVYSSSQLIELAPPTIGIEKLLALMEREGITFDELRRTLDSLSGKRVHVVGDTIVDSYTHTRHDRRPDQDADHERAATSASTTSSAAPAIVAKHLRAAGRRRDVLDRARRRRAARTSSLDDLDASGRRRAMPIIDRTRPTTNKNAIVAGGYRLLKIDTLDNRSISDAILARA